MWSRVSLGTRSPMKRTGIGQMIEKPSGPRVASIASPFSSLSSESSCWAMLRPPKPEYLGLDQQHGVLKARKVSGELHHDPIAAASLGLAGRGHWRYATSR